MSKNRDFFEKINEAFFKGDVDFLIENLTEDVQWDMVGETKVEGKTAVQEMMEPMRGVAAEHFETTNLITHGNMAVIEGKMTIPAEDGNLKTYAFCDIYKLDKHVNGKIKEITAYLIEVEG